MKTVIVDVRTPKEFQEGSYPGAINIPVEEVSADRLEQFRDDHIALVCFSGNRAKKAMFKLEAAGYRNLSLMQNQMAQIIERSDAESGVWTIDRQFRLAIGLILAVFIIGNYVINSPMSFGILAVVVSGLFYSVITDNCFLKTMISKMPWNNRTSAHPDSTMAEQVEGKPSLEPQIIPLSVSKFYGRVS